MRLCIVLVLGLLLTPAGHPIRAQTAQQQMVDAFQRGLALKEAQEFAQAAIVFEDAIQFSHLALGNAGGTTHLDTVMIMEHKANCLFADYQLHEANELYVECLELARNREQQPAKDLVARTKGNLAAVAERIGDYQTAERFFRQAIQEDRSSHSRAFNRKNLGWLLYKADRLAEAQRELEAASQFFESRQDNDSQSIAATCKHALGMVSLKMGDVQRAQQLFQQGFQGRQTRLPARHRFQVHSKTMVGVADSLAGDHDQALRRLASAESLVREVWGNRHVETADVLHEFALIQSRAGRAQTALQKMHGSRQAYRSYMADVLIGLEQQGQLMFLQAERHRTMDALTLALQAAQDPNAVRLGWEWLLNSKGFSFEVLAQRRLLGRDYRGKEAELVQKLNAVRERISIQSQDGTASQGLSSEQARLAKLLGLAGEGGISHWATCGDIQAQLPPGTVLLDFAYLDRSALSQSAFGRQDQDPELGRYVAWVVSNHDIQLVDLGPASRIDKAIERVRQHLENASSEIRTNAIRAKRVTKQELRQLAKVLISPLEQYLGPESRLLISPDAELWTVPWASLVTQQDEYLIERNELSFVVTARQLLGRPQQTPGEFGVIMANPDFGIDQRTIQRQLRNARIDALRIPSVNPADRKLLERIPRNIESLPSTKREAEQVRPLMETAIDNVVYQYTAERAVESFVKVFQRPKMALFATHGFVLESSARSHPLASSGLIFAGVNKREASQVGDDGILTAQEVLDCDFRGTQLVVLSACDSALGKNQPGEGIASLQTAFHLAGAEQVCATLWQVSDQETQLLMTRFWQQIAQGQKAAPAMRAAQLDFIDNLKQRYGHDHPWLWAAPILTTY